MDLEKSIKRICCCICGAIQRFFGPPTPAVGDSTPNDGVQPGTGAPTVINPDKEPPTPKPVAGTPDDPQIPSPHQDTPLENTEQTPPKDPPKIGGKRDQNKSPKPPNPRPPPEANPELICREAPNHWQIFLTVPQGQNAKVSQGGINLSPDNDGEYPLSNFSQSLTVKVTENGQNETIELTDGTSPLIFKLRKNWKGDGRQTKLVSNGCYVVFAPHKWQRTGNAPYKPERCSDNEFSAHLFFRDDSGEADGFDKCSSFFQQKRFLLEGKTVTDDSDMGDLFVGISLELTDANNNWDGVSEVRVGEEGGGKWGESFKPASKNLATVLGDREGWFYVRIYDENVKMIDGFAFRRLVNLEAILSDGNPLSPKNIIAPGTGGHTATTLQFSGKIQVKSDNPHITVSDDNTAIVAPNPHYDETQWTLSDANRQVKVCVHLPRIWWCRNNADDEPGEWQDTAFTMSREEFRNNWETLIIMHLPLVARKICVGLDSFSQYDGAREYIAKRNDNTKQAEFKLRDFCDHKQISEYSSKEATLRIKCGEAECTLIRIPAEVPQPKPKPPTPIDEPPTVKGFSRPRRNKGFSLSELSESGLTVAKAKHLRIAVDGRRKTKHRTNTDILKNKEKLCQLSKK